MTQEGSVSLQEYSDEDLSGGVCRICYSGQSSGELISPCKCSGSLAYVHLSCLDTWIENRGSPKCEICDSNYPLSVNFKWWHIWNDIYIRHILRQEPIFIIISTFINAAYCMLFRPIIILDQLQQIIEELVMFIVVVTFMVTMLVAGILTRNLARYIAWKYEMNIFRRVPNTPN